MIPVPICGRDDWTVLMPEWRAAREQNPWWEWVSIHPTFLRDFYGLTRADVVGFMVDLGYRCEHLADEHEMHTLFWHPEGRTPVLPYGSP